jgi:hypothetical protein
MGLIWELYGTYMGVICLKGACSQRFQRDIKEGWNAVRRPVAEKTRVSRTGDTLLRIMLYVTVTV